MKLFGVVDLKAKSMVAVFSSVNEETAERSFRSLLTDPYSIYQSFPEDFALYNLADIDFSSGAVVICQPGNENLVSAGFNVGTFKISEAIKRGIDYDKRYLDLITQERMNFANNKKSECENKENE